jgi:undecaprenyl-diphosphatase
MSPSQDIVMGIFYLIAERFSKAQPQKQLTIGNVLFIGCAQALALIQGISRSGSTIGTGLLSGLTREQAARFSFVLGTPVIAGAVVLKSLDVVQGESTLPVWDATLVGLLTSLIAGYLSVAFLMKFLKNHRLTVFSVYLFALAAVGGLTLLN